MLGTARVLVVDDSPTIRRVVSSVLLRAGHDVSTADDGTGGLAEVRVLEPDLVLLDLTMPGLDGNGVLQRLHAEHGDEAPPVVLMCTRGDALAGISEVWRRLGVVDIITKPFSPEALLAVVHHSLDKHGRRQRPAEATRVVLAMASIAAADSDAQASFADDEFTTPGPVLATSTTLAGAPIQSTQARDVAVPPPRGLSIADGFDLVGELAVIALPEVLQLLKFQSQVGLLVVEAGGLHFDVGIDDGTVVSVVATDLDGGPARRGELILGRYFVTTGAINADDLEAHIASIEFLGHDDRRPLGERLVASGIISRDHLRHAIAEQAQDLMVELLRSRRGLFGLKSGAVHLSPHAIRPGWSVDGLLFEALRRIDEWAVMESEVPSFEARFAVRGTLDDDGLSAEEGTILRGLHGGPARVRDIVRRSPLRPFDVCRVLYRLAVLKRIQRIDDGDPRRLLSDDSPPLEPLLSTPPTRADS